MQSRNRNAVENKNMDTKGGRGSWMNWEIGTDTYTLLCIKYITNENLLDSRELSSMFCSDLNGKEIQKRRAIYMYF